MTQLIVTLSINTAGALLAVWLYVQVLFWAMGRYSGATRTAIGFLFFLLMAVLIVLSMSYVLLGASSVEAPWWAGLAAWVGSLLPALLYWAKRGRALRI